MGEGERITMARLRRARAVSLIVLALGVVEVLGWAFDVTFLKSVSPVFVTMKFSTAVCFAFTGGSMYFITRTLEGDSSAAQVILPAATLAILLFMSVLFISALFDIRTGVEDLFFREYAPVKSEAPGVPSIVTIFNFLVISFLNMLAMFNSPRLKAWLARAGVFIAVSGAVALLGYAFDQPLLYYRVVGLSTAMALNTAMMFILSGAGYILLGSG